MTTPKSAAVKLGLKSGLRVFYKNLPDSLKSSLSVSGLDSVSRLAGEFDRILLFTKSADEMNREFPRLKSHLVQGGVLWVAWPKGGKLGTDLNVPEVIRIGYNHGLVESNNIRVDETWTALKFTWPKPGKVYNNSYGKLPE